MARFLQPSELHGRAGCVKFSRNGFNLRRSAPRSLPQASFRTPTASVGSYTVTGNGITSACFFAIDAKLTRRAGAMLSSARKWPYVFIARAPASLCPSQRETVEISFHSLGHSAVTMLKAPGVSDFIAREIDPRPILSSLSTSTPSRIVLGSIASTRFRIFLAVSACLFPP